MFCTQKANVYYNGANTIKSSIEDSLIKLCVDQLNKVINIPSSLSTIIYKCMLLTQQNDVKKDWEGVCC